MKGLSPTTGAQNQHQIKGIRKMESPGLSFTKEQIKARIDELFADERDLAEAEAAAALAAKEKPKKTRQKALNKQYSS